MKVDSIASMIKVLAYNGEKSSLCISYRKIILLAQPGSIHASALPNETQEPNQDYYYYLNGRLNDAA
jgi:hypothetical protein